VHLGARLDFFVDAAKDLFVARSSLGEVHPAIQGRP
jgi:hypothetical protein